MNQSSLYHRIPKQLARYAITLGCLIVATNASAFDELNEVQALLWDKPHLSNTQKGQTISYHYRSEVADAEPVDDTVTVSITAQVDEERRDVEIDFLTEERHLAMPDFPGYRGNPVLMAMLEHVVQEIGKETGGGALYFRNRIRHVLASDKVNVENKALSVNDKNIDTTVLSFKPFEKDENLAADSIYQHAVFSITLSDTVPGGIVGIGVNARADGQPDFSRQITIQN